MRLTCDCMRALSCSSSQMRGKRQHADVLKLVKLNVRKRHSAMRLGSEALGLVILMLVRQIDHGTERSVKRVRQQKR